MLCLKKDTSPGAYERYKDLLAMIEETLTPEFSRKLLARTVANMPVVLKNIATFKDAARRVIKGARAADQISAMLAGAYLLHSTGEIAPDKAEEWISGYDWTEHTSIAAKTDPERLLQHISTSLIRVQAAQKDVTIGTLIVCALGRDQSVLPDTAQEILRGYSIVARWDGIDFGMRNKNLERLLRDTEWAYSYKKTLSALGGTKIRPATYFSPGDKQRAVRVPVSYFADEEQRVIDLDINMDSYEQVEVASG
jgi:hypothetical protein